MTVMPDLYLGIDTSNYKTSVAVTDASNDIVFAKSEYLEVPEGSRGLRQSDAFFRHSCRLPDYNADICSEVDVSDIRAAGVSSRPRRVEGSYMPCFLAGVNAAREIASVLCIPLHEFSHQEGHAAAVIESGTDVPGHASALFHLSGGTTEILICRPDEEGYSLEIAGGTKDISIGQLLDRTGVAMGYPFPSGMYLDELAQSCRPPYQPVLDQPRIRITDGWFNLSGTETGLLRYTQQAGREEYPSISHYLFNIIADLLVRSVQHVINAHDIDKIYMAGGVSSSSFIREKISSGLQDTDIVFGPPELSGDNAVGIARLARRIHESGNSNTAK